MAQVDLEKSQRILEQEESLRSSGKLKYIIMETLVLLFQPYSFLNSKLSVTQTSR